MSRKLIKAFRYPTDVIHLKESSLEGKVVNAFFGLVHKVIGKQSGFLRGSALKLWCHRSPLLWTTNIAFDYRRVRTEMRIVYASLIHVLQLTPQSNGDAVAAAVFNFAGNSSDYCLLLARFTVLFCLVLALSPITLSDCAKRGTKLVGATRRFSSEHTA